MGPLMIYALCLGGILALLCVKTFLGYIQRRWPPRSFVYYLHLWTLSTALHRRKWLRRVGWNELVVQLLYWVGTLACNGAAVKDLTDAGSRAASLALVQFMFLLVGSRLHLVADMLGVSLETIFRIHRTVAWMAVLQSGIHIVIVSRTKGVRWDAFGNKPGIMVAACLGAMILASVKPMRQHVYELFIKLHYGLALCTLVFLWLHILHVSPVPSLWKPSLTLGFLEVTSLILIVTTLGQIVRILCYNFVPGKSLPIVKIHQWKGDKDDAPDAIKICVLLPRAWEIRAGQTVYLYLKTMKFWTLPEAHPFSIAWWQEPRPLPCVSGDDISVQRENPGSARRECRPLDDHALRDIQHFGRDEDITGQIEARINEENYSGLFPIWLLVRPETGLTSDISDYRSEVDLRAIVDGPYGGNHRLDRYGHVVMFAQGIGIAAQMSYLRTFFYGSLNGELPTRRITLIWETCERDLVIVQSWMTHLLTEDHDNYSGTLMLNVQLYVLDQQNGWQYGRRVRVFAGPVDARAAMRQELKNCRGRMLVTVSASERFIDELRLHMLELMGGDFKNEQVEMLCLDFQPRQPHKRTSDERKNVQIVGV